MKHFSTSVLTLASWLDSEPSAGHSYWYHKALREAFQTIALEYTLVGPMSNSFLTVPHFSLSGAWRSRTAYFPWIFLGRDLRVIELNVRYSPNQVFLHVYEGGFRELLLVLSVIEKNCNASAAFNFTLVDPWVSVFVGSGFKKSLARKVLKSLVRMYSPRIDFYAETIELAKALELDEVISIREYPLFSTVKKPKMTKNRRRDIDVFFCPGDDSEANLCLDALEILEKESTVPTTAFMQFRWGWVPAKDTRNRIQKLKVSEIPSNLEKNGYADIYSRSKVVVLPYLNQSHYKYQTSGRLLDAAISGAQVYSTFGTAVARLAEQNFNGGSFDPDNPRDLASKLKAALHRPQNSKFHAMEPVDSAVALLESSKFLDAKYLKGHFVQRAVLGFTFGLVPIFSSFRNFLSGMLLVLRVPFTTISLMSRILKRFIKID